MGSIVAEEVWAVIKEFYKRLQPCKVHKKVFITQIEYFIIVNVFHYFPLIRIVFIAKKFWFFFLGGGGTHATCHWLRGFIII